MKTTDPRHAAVDKEYHAALLAWKAARAALGELGEQRIALHLATERERSTERQRMLNMTDEEWEAFTQDIATARAVKLEPTPFEPGG